MKLANKTSILIHLNIYLFSWVMCDNLKTYYWENKWWINCANFSSLQARNNCVIYEEMIKHKWIFQTSITNTTILPNAMSPYKIKCTRCKRRITYVLSKITKTIYITQIISPEYYNSLTILIVQKYIVIIRTKYKINCIYKSFDCTKLNFLNRRFFLVCHVCLNNFFLQHNYLII